MKPEILQKVVPFVLTFCVAFIFIVAVIKSVMEQQQQLKDITDERKFIFNCTCKQNVTENRLFALICERMTNRNQCESNFTFYAEEEINATTGFLIDKKDLCAINSTINKSLIVAAVHSRVNRRNQRDAIRETWGKYAVQRGITVIFFVAKSRKSKIQSSIERESSEFNDLIQFPFIEDYYNLTLKAIAILNTLKEKCPNVTFVLKVDEDVIVNVDKVLQVIDDYRNASMVSIGAKVMNERQNNVNNKFFVPWFIYDKDYPKRPGGPLHLFSGDCIQPLLSQCYKLNPFYIDDAYVFGIVARNVGIRFIPTNNISFGSQRIASFLEDNRFSDYLGIEGYNDTEMRSFWSKSRTHR